MVAFHCFPISIVLMAVCLQQAQAQAEAMRRQIEAEVKGLPAPQPAVPVGATQPAALETGAVAQVVFFLKDGEMIRTKGRLRVERQTGTPFGRTRQMVPGALSNTSATSRVLAMSSKPLPWIT